MNNQGNYFALSALVVADLARVHLEARVVPQQEREGKDYKDRCFLTMTPVLEAEGTVLYDSQAIAGYLARVGGKQ